MTMIDKPMIGKSLKKSAGGNTVISKIKTTAALMGMLALLGGATVQPADAFAMHCYCNARICGCYWVL